jgi:hypothetical protein
VTGELIKEMKYMRNHKNIVFNFRGILSLYATLAVSAILVLPSAGLATIVSLTDLNSTAQVNVDSPAGMNFWSVDGQNQLNQQWFWYRTDDGVAKPINTISSATHTLYGDNTLDVTYENQTFILDIIYSLTGGTAGSGKADITETLTVNNKTGSELNFHLYQYSDFNLLNVPGGDSVVLNGNTTDGYDFAYQWKGLTQIAEVINLPPANEAEAGTTDETPNTLYKLNNYADLMLNGSDSAGPGDVTWALQWDTTIDANDTFDVFKDKKLSIVPIPEPSAWVFVALGLGAWKLARRRQSS